MCLKGYSSYTRALICQKSRKSRELPDKDHIILPRHLRAELRSLSDYTDCYTQASQVSTWLGVQSGSGILKGMINLLPKPDERLSFHNLTAKERLATMHAK